MIQYGVEGERLADTSACAGSRADLKMCLLETDCCKVVSKFICKLSVYKIKVK